MEKNTLLMDIYLSLSDFAINSVFMKLKLITEEYANANTFIRNLSFSTNTSQSFELPERGAAIFILTSNTGDKKIFDVVHFHNHKIVNINRIQDELLYYDVSGKNLVVTCSVNWSYGLCIMSK